MNAVTASDHALRIRVWSVIAAEATVFVAMLLLRGTAGIHSSPSGVLLAGATAAALFGGASTLASTLRHLREGRNDLAARRLVLGGVLGFATLVLELTCVRLIAPTDRVSIGIVGLHTAHVAAGLALVLWILALVRTGYVHRRRHDVVALVVTYWYFVAGVWMAVWPVLSN